MKKKKETKINKNRNEKENQKKKNEHHEKCMYKSLDGFHYNMYVSIKYRLCSALNENEKVK